LQVVSEIPRDMVGMMKTMKFSELKRLTFCNSEKLLNKQFFYNDQAHEWVGIGMVECNADPNKEHIRVIDK